MEYKLTKFGKKETYYIFVDNKKRKHKRNKIDDVLQLVEGNNLSGTIYIVRKLSGYKIDNKIITKPKIIKKTYAKSKNGELKWKNKMKKS